MPQLDSAFNYNTPAFSSAHCVPQDYNASSSMSSPILLAQSSSAQHSSILLPSHINSYHFWTGYWTKSDQNLHTCCLAGQPGGVHGPAAQETHTLFTERRSHLPVRLREGFANLTLWLELKEEHEILRCSM